MRGILDQPKAPTAICCVHSHTYEGTQNTYQPKTASCALPLAGRVIHDLVFHLVAGMGRSQQVDEVGIVLVQGTLARTTWPTRPVRSTQGRLSRGAGWVLRYWRAISSHPRYLPCTVPSGHLLLKRSRRRCGEPRQIRRGEKDNDPLDCLSSPLAKVALTAILATPDRASLVRKADEFMVAFQVASA